MYMRNEVASSLWLVLGACQPTDAMLLEKFYIFQLKRQAISLDAVARRNEARQSVKLLKSTH